MSAQDQPGPPDPLHALLGLDRVVHEPVRLALLSLLAGAGEAEFKFLESALGLSKGNLSSHAGKLEDAGYIEVRKVFRGKLPVTSYRITDAGRAALGGYWAALRGAAPGGG